MQFSVFNTTEQPMQSSTHTRPPRALIPCSIGRLIIPSDREALPKKTKC
jgi:hypothetical protein